MSVAIVTGAGGLVGSEAVRRLVREGYYVIGIENNMRREFFGEEGSTEPTLRRLEDDLGTAFRPIYLDIRNREGVETVVGDAVNAPGLDLLIHTAAQPSHDWAAREPHTDFGVNAVGTMNLIEAVRQHNPDVTFCHISTSKVYGDNPNLLPLKDMGKRLDLEPGEKFRNGIDTRMSIDNCLHSLFGVSKASGDLIVQEYGRYFGIPTVCFRPWCVTGPGHAGVELHGFLAYLVKCCYTGRPYTIYGYEGKQVRCNIDARDLVAACLAFHEQGPQAGAVYNIGGGRESNCSMLEAIEYAEQITGKKLDYTLSPEARIGDHRWWISDNGPFRRDYAWSISLTWKDMMDDILQQGADEW